MRTRGWLVLAGLLAACGDDARAGGDAGGDGGPDASIDAPLASCDPVTPPTTGWHVSPTGTPGGNGSIGSPWDLKTAIAPAPQIQPGDTVWLHGGTYTGAPFVAKLLGTAGNPITMRSYPGEWAVIDGAGSTDTIFQVYRSYGRYRDFEIVDSTPHTQTARKSATWFEGTGIELINTVIHDTGNVAMYEEAPDLLVYGNLIYNIGYEESATRSHGHNLYIQNDTGAKTVQLNAIFNGYSFGVHAYAEAGSHLRNMTFSLNALWGSGAPAPGTDQNKDNFLLGHTTEAADQIALRDNFTWARPINERSVALGYGVPNGSLQLDSNYFVGGLNFRDAWSAMTITSNTFIGPVTGMIQTSSYPMNTYATTAPTQTEVFMRSNQFEPGRAMIVVYNWAHATSFSFDPQFLLATGTAYEVRRAQDYFGAPAATGIYDGGMVTVPFTGAPPVQPIGSPGAIDPAEATGMDFDVFILRAACP